METIRDRGVTTISIGRDTALKLKDYARGRAVYEVVDELIEDALSKDHQYPLPGKRVSKQPATKFDLDTALSALNDKLDSFVSKIASIEPEQVDLFKSFAAMERQKVTPGSEIINNEIKILVERLNELMKEAEAQREPGLA